MNDDINHTDWLDFISHHDNATIFHHPAWTDVLKECYGYEANLITKGENKIVGLVPVMDVSNWLAGRRAVSLPFSDFCQPLFVGSIDSCDMVDHLQTWRRQHNFSSLEVRWQLEQQDGVYAGDSFYQHDTPLANDPDKVFHQFKRTQVQQPIRQAEKLGLTIRRSASWEDIRLFYSLHIETRRRLGSPVQPLRFFRLIWERLILKGLGFLLFAYKEDTLLAGALLLHLNKTLTFKFSASNPAFWELRPNNLLLWHAIRWGCENGYQVFDWGKTDLNHESLRDFKRGWGSEERVIHYSILADRPPSPGRAYGRLKRLMSETITHSPLWVCRLIGELFYVYAS